jgi:hypothetical protein
MSNLQQTPRTLFRSPKPPKPRKVPEWKLQAAVVSDFHKWQDAGWPFEFAGDFNAGKRNGGRAKLTGLKAGEPDIRIYLGGAKLKMIEMKTGVGKLSKEQKERHNKLDALDFEIATVFANDESDAVNQCQKLLVGWLADGTSGRLN